jgi:hypothetical protein
MDGEKTSGHKDKAMTRNRFLILLLIGTIAFFVMDTYNIEHTGGYTFIYFIVIFEWRRWWLNKSWWYWWNPKHIPEQFKKP